MLSKRLVRSESNRRLAGVCGGLADHLDIDPTLVRMAFVLLTFASGVGVMLYIIMAVITPTASAVSEEFAPADLDPAAFKDGGTDRRNSQTFVALLLAGAGLYLLLVNVGVNIGAFWPLLLIGLGIWQISRRRRAS